MVHFDAAGCRVDFGHRAPAAMRRIGHDPGSRIDEGDERVLIELLLWFGVVFVGLVGTGTWAYRRSGSLIAARSWLGEGKPPTFEAAVRHSVRRHLAAFGPASLEDISSWTHIRVPPIRDAIAALGSKVRAFYRAILDPADPDPVVIDRHAFDVAVGRVTSDRVRRVLVDRSWVYDAVADAYRAAAAELSARTGELWTPSELQAATWETWRARKRVAQVTPA